MNLIIKVVRVILFILAVILFASSMPVFAVMALLIVFVLSKLIKKKS